MQISYEYLQVVHEPHQLVVGGVGGEQRARGREVRVERVHVAQLPVALASAAQQQQ